MVKSKRSVQKKTQAKYKNLFEKTPRNYRIGGAVLPKRDLTRFVKWPKYIVLQRQRRILYKRLKVPAVIHQFTNVLPADKSKSLFKLLGKYKPETRAEKKERLKDEAEKTKNGEEVNTPKPKFVKCGLNHVTTLIEQKKAKLVVVAQDVDPIELVMFLPHLCRNKGVPYCIVKSKSALGQFVNKKSATCLAFTEVSKEDEGDLNRLASAFTSLYNNNKQHLTEYGDIVLGAKAQKRIEIAQRIKEAEVIGNQ
ncbi:MAG: hypothetical protein GY827_01205 [Cytophagales bacterium]|nr:hypothetical protein [Cytophagales bacterium]